MSETKIPDDLQNSHKAWRSITWSSRPDFIAWRYEDDTQTGIEILAYNNAFGDGLAAFYLERAYSIKAIGSEISECVGLMQLEELYLLSLERLAAAEATKPVTEGR